MKMRSKREAWAVLLLGLVLFIPGLVWNAPAAEIIGGAAVLYGGLNVWVLNGNRIL